MSFSSERFENKLERRTCDIVAKVRDDDIVVNEFKLPSCYYVYFQTNTLVKSLNLHTSALPCVK